MVYTKMAVTKLGLSTGTFVPLAPHNTASCRDGKTTWSGKTYYTYDFRFKNENPKNILSWLRTNMGERGKGWDFVLNSSAGTMVVEIWDSKLQFMYEMWKV